MTSELAARFPVTLSLALGAVVFAALVGIPLGLAGRHPARVVRSTAALSVGTSFGIALPDFFLGHGAGRPLRGAAATCCRPSGYVDIAEDPVEWARHLLMPWIALGLAAAASLARQVRGAMIEVLEADYIRTARSKGLTERRVIGKHALKNAMTPAMTVLGPPVRLPARRHVHHRVDLLAARHRPATCSAPSPAGTCPVIQGVVLLVGDDLRVHQPRRRRPLRRRQPEGPGLVTAILNEAERVGAANATASASQPRAPPAAPVPPATGPAWSASILLLLIVALAVFAPWVAPYDPDEQSYLINDGPSGDHWLGTDDLGRDLLSRVIYGARPSLLVAGRHRRPGRGRRPPAGAAGRATGAGAPTP